MTILDQEFEKTEIEVFEVCFETLSKMLGRKKLKEKIKRSSSISKEVKLKKLI
jgi:hypothetical protein